MARASHQPRDMNSVARNLPSIKRSARARSVAAALVVSAVAVTQAGCSKSGSKPDEQSCSGSQALSKTGLTGASLPLKTLALTFDDGPGARTVELSAYLKAQGIRAAFFVYGVGLKNDGAAGATLQHIIDDGHMVANHTETHRSLTMNDPLLTDAEIVAELTQVDAVIAPFVKDDKFLFRPPYGQFDDKTFDVLEKSPMKKYVGPILWNIGGTQALPNQASDAECWATKTPVETCGNAYLKEIANVGKGIVLLHDPYFIDQNQPESGGTYQMIQYMVPKLKADGYKFARVDEVPDIAALLPGGQSLDGGADGGTGETPPGDENTTTDPLGTEPCP